MYSTKKIRLYVIQYLNTIDIWLRKIYYIKWYLNIKCIL